VGKYQGRSSFAALSFALISISGSVVPLPQGTTFDDLRFKVGGYAELVEARNGSRINAYVGLDSRLGSREANPVATAVMGVHLKGVVVLVGAYDEEGQCDEELSAKQWQIIRSEASH